MTIRVTPQMRKRIDDKKNEKELVTDDSYKDIHNKGWIYTSPDRGKTIYRQPAHLAPQGPYCESSFPAFIDSNPDDYISDPNKIYDDVSGVKIDKSEQLELELKFDEFKANPQYQAGYSDAMAFMEDREEKISQLTSLLGEAAAYAPLLCQLAAASASLLGEVTEGIKKLRDNN